jgi:hypothetical protein
MQDLWLSKAACRLHEAPIVMLSRTFLKSALFGSIATLVLACSPSTETTREKGTTDANGYALLQASSPSDNHHFSVDVSLRSAPPGTYALLYSTTEPQSAKEKKSVVLRSSDPSVRCASGHGRECVHSESNSVILSIAKVGPGGTGVLRTTFDVGTGGWFAITRVVDTEPSSAAIGPASFDIVIVSEAIAKDEEPQRFVIVTH